MKRTTCLATVALAASLSGCVVAPVRPAFVAPPGVAVVAPLYPVPGAGFVWAYHGRRGWGWHHPMRGWHRGWR
jgi:hypothetical protein